MNFDKIIRNQCQHWKKIAEENLGTVQAVGSESIAHKHLRYLKISELFEGNRKFSVHDIGAGVGDFYEYLRARYSEAEIDYSASEVLPEYCKIANRRFPDIKFLLRDILAEPTNESYDYVVLSGVFHQQGNTKHTKWVHYMHGLINGAWRMARRGIAFNVISSYADFYKPGNYYADLAELQGFVVRNLSRFFRMDHSYPLFEGTFYVYHNEYIKKLYNQPELSRYIESE